MRNSKTLISTQHRVTSERSEAIFICIARRHLRLQAPQKSPLVPGIERCLLRALQLQSSKTTEHISGDLIIQLLIQIINS